MMDSTNSLGECWVAHVDVALDCQGKGQPVGGCVEDLRSGLQEELKEEAGIRRPEVRRMTTEGVVVQVPGGW